MRRKRSESWTFSVAWTSPIPVMIGMSGAEWTAFPSNPANIPASYGGTGSLMKSMMNCTFPISWASSGYISMASFLHRNPWRESEASASMRGWRVSSTTSLTLLMRNGLPSVNKSERETPGLPILVFSVRPVMAMVGMMCLPPKPTVKTRLWKSGLFKAERCIHGLPKLYCRPYQEG